VAGPPVTASYIVRPGAVGTEKVRRYSKMSFVAGPEVENVLKSQVP